MLTLTFANEIRGAFGCYFFTYCFNKNSRYGFFFVPTPSMQSSIHPGEHILISKLHYGPRWPQRPLDIAYFNLLAFVPSLTDWFVNTTWPYRRWPQPAPVERDDVLVFDAPFKFKDKLVKRCVGLPGDTVEVRQHQAYVNHLIRSEAKDVQHTPAILAAAQSNPLANYGPLVTPQKGQTLAIDTATLRYYQKTIQREGHTVETEGDSVLIDGQWTHTYTFQHNYFFMLGDNRTFSMDSRKWGLVPEKNIIGKAVRVLWSRDPQSGSIRWSRLFNSIN